MSSNRRSDTRVAILDAARKLFETQGYFGTGLDAVAKKAGVSRQAIYLHFESKDALLRELHARVNELDVTPAFAQVWTATSALDALDAWVVASAEAIPKFLALANALSAGRHHDPDIEATWDAPMAGQYAQCRRLASWLQRDGVLGPRITTRYAADMLWHYTHIHAYEALVVERGWPVARWIGWLKSTLRHELAPATPAVSG